MRSYGKVTLGLLAVWFVTVFSLAGAHSLQNTANRFGAGVAIAASAPLLVFAVWFAASKGYREFLLGLNPRILTAAQTFRLVGFVFVLLEARNLLPSVFALSAGYGDMAIGATATLVAWQLARPEYRGAFILWQVLGILDLVNAVGMGTTAQLLQPAGPTMRLMTVLPLSLIPTFFVPLFTIFHVISIAQARKWSGAAIGSRKVVTAAFVGGGGD
jgi:hypothetical protein